jgi:hypothetical protein
MELTAKEILRKRIELPYDPMKNEIIESAILAAMKEACVKVVEETVQICKEHSEDGCIDHEGAETNAMNFIYSLFPESKDGIVVSNGITSNRMKNKEF